ncbi:hypothetical protein [Pseudomonas panipatensis]|jgi:hypothetical protein|uniref:hypothetical protein n=1 Tax=Pseudomonas panipatensis TaxID=428992 RepID=UPI0035ADEF65
MRRALILSALLGLLTGCAGTPPDPSGVWINQAAIDAASKSGKLREALLAYGPNLEWRLDSKAQKASFSNGFELGEGQLSHDPNDKKHWQVAFYGSKQETLAVDGKQLLQTASENWPEQRFSRPQETPTAQAPAGASFQHALYGAFLKGTWIIKEGQGQGSKVSFQPDGRLDGMPNADRYALCLAGDCAAMSGDNDSIWLQQGRQGREYLFQRNDDKLELFEAVNRAQSDEMPEYNPGRRVWLLERD